MGQDKRQARQRLRTLPERLQRLLSFGIYAASFEVPPETRADEMVAGLQWFMDRLHAEGYAAPRWLLRPFWYFRRGVVIQDLGERPTSHLMLGLVEQIVEGVPEAERDDAVRELLYFFRGIYAERGMEPPEWLRLGLERYGEDEGEELPPDVMLDVVDASVLALPEDARSQARRSVLEFYAGLYTSRGAPVPSWVRIGLNEGSG
jgi:hypothetical protein